MLKLQNTIQPYAWGSHTAIAQLLGQATPSEHPQAELWMGAHPKASSKIWYQGRWQGLDDLLRQDPVPLLGQAVVTRFGPQLPYLFKVLAVEKPLSIQAHPSQSMAEAGFSRENQQGIALSAPHRNYRDDRHKPECICALTEFHALCGFRAPEEIRALLDPVWPAQYKAHLNTLKSVPDGAGLRHFFSRLMTMDKSQRIPLVNDVVAAAQKLSDQSHAFDWVVRLHAAYPEDVGVLSPLLLHLIRLRPGQALFLPAGRMHAYLRGVAIEVMANSDNVLRGGLTSKHVDVDELLRVLDFQSYPLEVLKPQSIGHQEQRYPSPADEFELSMIRIQDSQSHDSGRRLPAPEILLCVDGIAKIQWEGSSKGMDLARGESILVPAALTRYQIQGQTILYKAAVHSKVLLAEKHSTP
ncbi:MAG: mannose-6-phosphate isomerase, class I [Desulfobacterales bacterium]|nr:mannose-6-phosphate isomerase, class I [Desulfobacterales bacterium]